VLFVQSCPTCRNSTVTSRLLPVLLAVRVSVLVLAVPLSECLWG